MPGILDDINAIARVAHDVMPAVVQITNRQVGLDDFLRAVPVEAGSGSGVIFDPSGLILTNYHVIQGSRVLQVTLPDERIFDAEIVGADRRSDLALLKIEGTNLPTAKLGDSDQLVVGEWVIAIGNALALEGGPTVTAGVVGALDQYIESGSSVLFDLIQTDAAINPGNSGGPLLNLNGHIVGINTAMIEAPGAGIGFAISINSAKPVVADLRRSGSVTLPWPGITPITINPDLARRYQLPASRGVIVARVDPATPTARAGLLEGDIISAMDDSPIRGVANLLEALSGRHVGDTVKIKIIRLIDDRPVESELTIELEAMPS